MKDRIPRTFFASPAKQTPKLDMDLVEAAERRCALVEDQMASLKELFQVQWGMSRQLKQDISSIQSELDAAKCDLEKFNVRNAQLLAQMEAVCGERDERQHELQEHTTTSAQVERDFDAANASKDSLSTQICSHPSHSAHTLYFSPARIAW